MSRKKAREIALHLVFEMGFQTLPPEEMLAERLDEEIMRSIGTDVELYAGKLSPKQVSYITEVVRGVTLRREELDGLITAHAHGWSLDRLSKMTVAILRLALYEMRYVEDVPVGAAINEAVELAKVYDAEEAGAFINGLLGAANRAEANEKA